MLLAMLPGLGVSSFVAASGKNYGSKKIHKPAGPKRPSAPARACQFTREPARNERLLAESNEGPDIPSAYHTGISGAPAGNEKEVPSVFQNRGHHPVDEIGHL